MKNISLFLALLVTLPAVAAGTPTDASVKELLQVMEAERSINAALDQMDSMMQKAEEQAFRGKEMTPEMRKTLETMQQKTIALMKDEMSPAKMQPDLVAIYQNSFSQYEVDGMLTFYKSDVGRAVTAKMPAVMQNTTLVMQRRMTVLAPKLQKIQAEMMAELCKQSGCDKGTLPPSTTH